jgi:hypothetical protein
VIRLEAIQLRQLAADVLRQLAVSDSVQVLEVRELSDGSWMVTFNDRAPYTRFPAFEIAVQPDWTADQVGRELRLELRQKLWICPLCQRRAEMRRIVDSEAFRVDCERCGRFEIDQPLLEAFRSAYEDLEPAVVGRLEALSRAAARTGNVSLTADNWRALAESAAE